MSLGMFPLCCSCLLCLVLCSSCSQSHLAGVAVWVFPSSIWRVAQAGNYAFGLEEIVIRELYEWLWTRLHFSFFQNVSNQYLGEVFFDTSLFVHCGFLVVLTYQGFCSAFISAIWVAFPLFTKLCVYKDFKKHGRDILVFDKNGNCNKNARLLVIIYLTNWVSKIIYFLCHTIIYLILYPPSHSHVSE